MDLQGNTTTAELDPHDPLPLWAQLARVLRDAIVRGEYLESLPSEYELRERFGVSRATIREAIRSLKEEGLLHSRRGSGTYISGAHSLERIRNTSYSLAREISALGLEETSKVLKLEVVTDAVAASALSLPPESEVLLIARIRLGSNVPMALDHSWLRLPEAGGLLHANLSRGSLYENLLEHCNVLMRGGVDRFKAGVVGDEESELLALEPGTAVIVAERFAHSGDTPLEYRRTTLAANRLTLSASWGYSAPLTTS